MKRASQLFLFEERDTGSPYVEKLWRTHSEQEAAFISVAVAHWEMVVTRQRGRTTLTVRGPETVASTSPIPQDAEFFGIQFHLGSFMPNLSPVRLVDGALTLPAAGDRSFWLNGSAWQFPQFEDGEMFVRRLVREGLLVCDPVVELALHGRPQDLSPRSVQRRVRRATGLTQGTIRQIERAKDTVGLLERGVPIAEAAACAGYSDQAHLTRSLRRFVGQTPSEIGVASIQDRRSTLG